MVAHSTRHCLQLLSFSFSNATRICKELSHTVARCSYTIWVSRKHKFWDRSRTLLTPNTTRNKHILDSLTIKTSRTSKQCAIALLSSFPSSITTSTTTHQTTSLTTTQTSTSTITTTTSASNISQFDTSFDFDDCDIDDIINSAVLASTHVEHKHSPTPCVDIHLHEEPNSDEDALAAEFIDGW